MKRKLELIVENAEDGKIWGRIQYKEDLLTSSARDLEQLEENFKEQLEAFYDLEPENIRFEISYDIGAFFEVFEDVNMKAIGRRAKLNESLLRQYKTGVKRPSSTQVLKIQEAVHNLGRELLKTRFATVKAK